MAYKFTPARKKALKKARRTWQNMSPTARQKAMPPRTPKERIKELKRKGKYYPEGQYVTIDVGRPKHTYIVTQKTKHGWTKPKTVKYEDLKKKVKKARQKWMKMSPRERAKAMPGGKI